MILLFGGTTEGRKAVTELEEAGKTFYYSTKTGEQNIELCHGIAVKGAMTYEKMTDFCKSNHIQLMIDAAHPFAARLHSTVADVSEALGIAAIRFERIFPERAADIEWCDNYDEAIRLLRNEKAVIATTGVQSISKLKILEQTGTEVYYRILNRPSSVDSAKAQGATEEHLIFMDNDDLGDVAERIREKAGNSLYPIAILLKESGMTGGFLQKAECARNYNMRIVAIRRPPTPKGFVSVNGEHGLRRAVERLLPDFYPLHSGLTTGTYATAAAIAACKMAECKEKGQQTDNDALLPPEVGVVLPNGETIPVEVHYGDNYAYTIKESGDDPDITDGAEIRAYVEPSDHFEISGGNGVGRFTLPGFDYPPGEFAINRVPREMIRNNLANRNLRVTISVVNGEELALRTFNPRLGIEGGISIIGVSGIIKPFSEEAFIDSIRKCMTVAAASGTDEVVINSGAKSERFIKPLFTHLPSQAFVEYGNYIGATISIASELGISRVSLVMMMGKAVKLAAGHLDTHSRRSTMDKTFIARMMAEAGCTQETIAQTGSMTLARQLWDIIPENQIESFVTVLICHCRKTCAQLLPDGKLRIIIIDEGGKWHEGL